jgi:acetyl esterase
MILDKDAEALLARLVDLAPQPYHTLMPEQARAAQVAARKAAGVVPPDLSEVADLTAEGPAGPIALRLYRPSQRRDRAEPFLIFFHGGGFVIGDLDSHDILCRKLALGAGLPVVSVHYRLAPEHRFPACLEDAAAAIDWIFEHTAAYGLDAAAAGIGGDSAGATIATVMALSERDAGRNRFRCQLLIYPVIDLTNSRRSHDIAAPGLPVTGETMRWFRDHYLSSLAEQTDWRASPIFARDLSGLPTTFLVTAGYDPLWDEGDAYARRLQEAGVTTELRHYSGQIHGFLTLGAQLPTADVALQECAAFVARTLARA